MFYTKNDTSSLSKKLFKNPTSEYRGTPFWSWNCKITRQLIDEQITMYKKMGVGGFHIHPRTGLETAYMSGEYMDLISYACDRAKREGMYAYLYDEDRYPSGAAGGLVTENLKYRQRFISLTMKRNDEYEPTKDLFEAKIEMGEKPIGYFLAAYQVVLDENGCLKYYKRIDIDEEITEGRKWYAYLRLAKESPWYNDQTYIDVFNKEAVERFIEVTHEKYRKRLSKDFGGTIPSIFTDEPQMAGKFSFATPDATRDATLSYTDDMDESYKKIVGVGILDILPEILWQLPDNKPSVYRYLYHDHLAERFAAGFSDTIGEWCEKNNINFTGHYLSERTLFSQTLALSEAMRLYRGMQWPGLDILADQKELTTAKQTVSVARQYAREAVICEMYGAMHWDFDFKGHKLQGDWLAALGVTIRNHHLTLMSMEGEAKRDWPASIGYQSPWYKEYPYVENHFARLNTALTRGKASVRVGVIHPIESYWINYGPNSQTKLVRDQLDNNYEMITQWLLYGTIDFDLISESMLPSLCEMDNVGAALPVGSMSYDAVVVPGLYTIRSSTLDRLEKFVEEGGKVVFAGRIPEFVDAEKNDRALVFAEKCNCVSFERAEILEALKDVRDVEIINDKGAHSDNLIIQMREDTDNKWLFVCHVNRKKNLLDKREKYYITLRGEWKATLYDTITGEIIPYAAKYAGGNTQLKVMGFAEDSYLFLLEPGMRTEGKETTIPKGKEHKLAQPYSVSLEEPNVLLLDYAQVSLDGGEWSERMDILSADNLLRAKLGLPRRQDHFTQPWRIPNEKYENIASVKMNFDARVAVSDAFLALERPAETEIYLDGQLIPSDVNGYYVDKAIKTVYLGDISEGEHEIILRLPFGRKSNLEWCYILGNFAVHTAGAVAYIDSWRDSIYYGDVVNQGLSFYGGNITYHIQHELKEDAKDVYIHVPHFAAICLSVDVNGERKGMIAYAPHKLYLGDMPAGTYDIAITAYGSRYNSFGTIHNSNDEYKWYGPDSYRTSGSEWSDSYLLKPNGILTGVSLQYD